MAIISTPDHVAIAVPDIEAAAARWRDELGGGWVWQLEQLNEAVAIRQMRFPNQGKLELLQPMGPGFARNFIERFGPRVHHVTLKVPDALMPAVEAVRADGYDVIDINTEGGWHEAFLRPSQVGGIIVQLAWEAHDDEEWFEESGHTPEPPRGDAALLGPTLTHPDLEAAERFWRTVGGTITRDGDALMVGWEGAPLTVRIEPGPTAGPLGLRFAGVEPLPADDVVGPAVLVD
jgi:catechol 2,3-dioxygenase-like lactoylglutathione lyase family enzyme